MSASYRCKSCDSIVPHGHRMQYCECGKVFVDWGAGGRSSTVRVGWPGGDPDDWVEIMRPAAGVGSLASAPTSGDRTVSPNDEASVEP